MDKSKIEAVKKVEAILAEANLPSYVELLSTMAKVKKIADNGMDIPSSIEVFNLIRPIITN